MFCFRVVFRRIDTVSDALKPEKLADILQILKPEGNSSSSSTLFVNFGAHEAKHLRNICPLVNADATLQVKTLHGKREVSRWKSSQAQPPFEIMRNASLNRECHDGSLMPTAAKASAENFIIEVERFFEKVRVSGYTGRIIWRTIQINFAFDFRGAENIFKLHANHLATKSTRFIRLGVEVLDVERITGFRPESFADTTTNHFYCQCASECACGSVKECIAYEKDCSLVARKRCKTTECEPLRTNFHENGEPNRVISQLFLNSLDGGESSRFSKFSTRGSCFIVGTCDSFRGQLQGKNIDGARFVVRILPVDTSCGVVDAKERTDLSIVLQDGLGQHLHEISNTLTMIIGTEIQDATRPFGDLEVRGSNHSQALPYIVRIVHSTTYNEFKVLKLAAMNIREIFPFCSTCEGYGVDFV